MNMKILILCIFLSFIAQSGQSEGLVFKSGPYKGTTLGEYHQYRKNVLNLGVMQLKTYNNERLSRKFEYVKESQLKFIKLSRDLKSFVVDVSYKFDNYINEYFTPAAKNDTIKVRSSFELMSCDNRPLEYIPNTKKKFKEIISDFEEIRMQESLFCDFQLNAVLGNAPFSSQHNKEGEATWAYPEVWEKTIGWKLKPSSKKTGNYCDVYYRRDSANCDKLTEMVSDLTMRISQETGITIYSAPTHFKIVNQEISEIKDFKVEESSSLKMSLNYYKVSEGGLSDQQRDELREEVDRVLEVFYSYVDVLMLERDSDEDSRTVRLNSFFSEQLKEDFLRSTKKINELLRGAELIDVVDTHLKVLGAHRYVKYFELKTQKKIIFDHNLEVKL